MWLLIGARLSALIKKLLVADTAHRRSMIAIPHIKQRGYLINETALKQLLVRCSMRACSSSFCASNWIMHAFPLRFYRATDAEGRRPSVRQRINFERPNNTKPITRRYSLRYARVYRHKLIVERINTLCPQAVGEHRSRLTIGRRRIRHPAQQAQQKVPASSA